MKRILLALVVFVMSTAGTQSAIGISKRPTFDPLVEPVEALPPVKAAPSRGRMMTANLDRLPPELGMLHDPSFDFFLLFPAIPGVERGFLRQGVMQLVGRPVGDPLPVVSLRSFGPTEERAGLTPGTQWSALAMLTGPRRAFVAGPAVGRGTGTPGRQFASLPSRTKPQSGPFGPVGAFPVSVGGGGGGGNGSGAIPPSVTPPVSAVPLPMAGWMLLTGVAALAGLSRRKAARAA